MYKPFYPKSILVENRIASCPETKAILERLPDVPVNRINNVSEIIKNFDHRTDDKILVLAKQDGEFLKPCPGTSNYICCNYYFLNLATNCDINCSYCILQSYLNNPYMTVYTNLEKMFKELDSLLKNSSNQFYRIGTGELTDSLTLDHIIGYSNNLIPFFLKYPNAILELKTKTTQIDHLLKLSPENRVIISWSLNTEKLIRNEEKNAPSLKQRLLAAKKCAEAGYLIGFHFDPLIYYKNWEAGYRQVVTDIFKTVPADRIVWISLGALRYPREMDRIVRQRHPDSEIVLGEMFAGKDGKLRYFRPIREKMFRKMVSWIRNKNEVVPIYLCMESIEVWENAFGKQPFIHCGLSGQLDQAVLKCQGRI